MTARILELIDIRWSYEEKNKLYIIGGTYKKKTSEAKEKFIYKYRIKFDV